MRKEETVMKMVMEMEMEMEMKMEMEKMEMEKMEWNGYDDDGERVRKKIEKKV